MHFDFQLIGYVSQRLIPEHRIGDSLIEVGQGPEISDADEAGLAAELKNWKVMLTEGKEK